MNNVIPIEGEIWKLIDGYGEKYMISSHGRVKAILGANKWQQYSQERDLTPDKGRKQKYLNVTLLHEGFSKTLKVHRLVATYFCPNPDNKPYVNHKDMDKHNNHYTNLEWVTPKENNQHALKNGAFDVFYTPACKRNKYNSEQVREIHQMKRDGYEIYQIADKTNIPQGTISGILKGDRWPHIYKEFNL